MESKSTNDNNPKPAKRSFLDRFKRNAETTDESRAESEELPEPQSKISFGQRMRSALSRTGEGIGSLFLGTKVIDEALLEELETSLIMADVGIETTTKIIAELTKQLDRKSLKDGAALKDALYEILLNKLAASEGEINFDGCEKPFVMFVVGVNGVGKTTTIGKLASRLKSQGKSVMLAAGDTFRAAAVALTPHLQLLNSRSSESITGS